MNNEVTVKTRWYTYSQNNSGGHFYNDEKVAHYVCVQARSAAEANRIATEVTEESGYDWCECCGERWYIDASERDAKEVPSIYGRSVFEEGHRLMFRYRVVLYYFNGVVEYVDLK